MLQDCISHQNLSWLSLFTCQTHELRPVSIEAPTRVNPIRFINAEPNKRLVESQTFRAIKMFVCNKARGGSYLSMFPYVEHGLSVEVMLQKLG